MDNINNSPVFIYKGAEYFNQLVKLINGAKNEIHLQTYIFEPDNTGLEILEHLNSAAERGVKIHLVVDGYGSWAFISYLKKTKLHSNFQFKVFSPPIFAHFGYAGRRLHHKILVADKHKVLIGGINIADKYKGTEKEKAWLDFALLYTDTQPFKAYQICDAVFNKTFNVIYTQNFSNNADLNNEVKLLQNDWFRGKNQIYNFYKRKIKSAQNEIIIVAAYFLPGLRLRRALRKASARGVKIKLVLSGKSDVIFVKDATRYFYGFLKRNNIEIYEWTESVLHGKIMITDCNNLTVGSFNLNHLSQYGSLELNAVCTNTKTIKEAKLVLKEILSKCIKIESVQNFSSIEKAYQRICFFIIRAALILATIKPYFRKKVKVVR